jgi:protein-tyrosine phosphatase
MLPHRHISLKGSPNMRDLGGHPTQCGRRVQFNRLFRSGLLSNLDDAGWDFFQDANVKKIFDFRRPNEIKKTPTSIPVHLNIELVNLPIDPGSHGGIAKRMANSEEENQEKVADKMEGLYKDYVLFCTPVFSDFLHQILTLNENEAAIFHCMAGKDRTGFAAAMLLLALGVDRDTVEQEYMLTREYFLPRIEIERIKKRYEEEFKNQELKDKERNDSENISEQFLPVFDTRLNYLHSAFEAIEAQWGSLDAYIASGLGIDDHKREQLKTRFLEEA